MRGSSNQTYWDWIGSASWRHGQEVESKFGDFLKKHYKDVRPATLQEQYKHMDWICSIGSIDIKAMKAVERSRGVQSEFIWIEFKNNCGDAGWLYGEQDFLAFEGAEDYLLVRRGDLQELAEDLCNLDDKVESPKEALYKSYSRKNRRDVISMIRRDDLYKIKNKVLNK